MVYFYSTLKTVARTEYSFIYTLKPRLFRIHDKIILYVGNVISKSVKKKEGNKIMFIKFYSN